MEWGGLKSGSGQTHQEKIPEGFLASDEFVRLRPYKPYALVSLILVSVFLEVQVHYFTHVAVGFTHIFYIPIIVAGLWYYERAATLIGLFFAVLHLSVSVLVGDNLIDAFIRGYMFCLVGFVVGFMAHSNARYQEELERRTRKLEEQYRKLGLLSSVTRHDILNQLTVLMGYHELIDEELVGESLPKTYLQRARDAAKTIQQQVLFTRDYQNIGVNSPVWQNLSDVVGRAAAAVGTGTVALKVDVDDAEIFGDPLMEKVFSALIDNSQRHGERVTKISITFLKQGNKGIIVYQDDGVGIDPVYHDHLFEAGVGRNTGFGLF
ncbi:MAG: HAMP domain-containing histidine kinase, partial [Methanoregulaceae archaeon]|nr:HAMP domain-containing histidine kinase [Methanoregulaceae archaeon]